MSNAIAVLTNETTPQLLEQGYSGNWSFNKPRAENRQYLVCVRARNRGDSELNKRVFFVAKLKSVTDAPKGFRYRLNFDEYAEIDDVLLNRPWRNPVSYTSLEELGIDSEKLKFKRRRVRLGAAAVERLAQDDTPALLSKGLDISEAKKALAQHYNVPVESIEIIIRG
jgi:hypothetical protein